MRYKVFRYVLISCAENIVPDEYDVSCERHTVWFKNGDLLKVELKLQNFPKGLKHHISLLNGAKNIGNLHNTGEGSTINIKQQVLDGWSNHIAHICFSEDNVNCNIKSQDLIILKYSEAAEGNGCISSKCTLNIDWNKDCSGRTTRSNTYSPFPPAVQGNENAINKRRSSINNTPGGNGRRRYSFDKNNDWGEFPDHTADDLDRRQDQDREFFLFKGPKSIFNWIKDFFYDRDIEGKVVVNMANNNRKNTSFYDAFNENYSFLTTASTQKTFTANTGRTTEPIDKPQTPPGNGVNVSNPECRTELEGVPKVTVRPCGRPGDNSPLKISCNSRVKEDDLLSLYLSRENDIPELLKIDQHLNKRRDEMTITMNITLQDSDEKGTIYCVKQPICNLSVEIRSEENGLSDYSDFVKHVDAASISVEPAYAWFEPNTSLSFVCKGSPPLDGRTLNWYMQGTNTSEIQVLESGSQHYDTATNYNNLTLQLNESFHLKSLFCAEDYFLDIKYLDGHRIKRYGERKKSEVITLKLKQVEQRKGLIWGSAVGVAVVLLVLAALWWRALRRRRRAHVHNDNNEVNPDTNYASCGENFYATPGVTYAVLELPAAAAEGAHAHAHAAPPRSSYVEIVGVYNPRRR